MTSYSTARPSAQHRGAEIPTYWINLDASTDRRVALQRVWEAHEVFAAQRVPAVPVRVVAAMLGMNGTASVGASTPIGGISMCTLTTSFWEMLQTEFRSDRHTLAEVAITLSHRRALERAYDAGHAAALVVEDDVSLALLRPAELHDELRVLVASVQASHDAVVSLYTTGPPPRVRNLLAAPAGRLVGGFGFGAVACVVARGCMRPAILGSQSYEARMRT